MVGGKPRHACVPCGCAPRWRRSVENSMLAPHDTRTFFGWPTSDISARQHRPVARPGLTSSAPLVSAGDPPPVPDNLPAGPDTSRARPSPSPGQPARQRRVARPGLTQAARVRRRRQARRPSAPSGAPGADTSRARLSSTPLSAGGAEWSGVPPLSPASAASDARLVLADQGPSCPQPGPPAWRSSPWTHEGSKL